MRQRPFCQPADDIIMNIIFQLSMSRQKNGMEYHVNQCVLHLHHLLIFCQCEETLAENLLINKCKFKCFPSSKAIMDLPFSSLFFPLHLLS